MRDGEQITQAAAVMEHMMSVIELLEEEGYTPEQIDGILAVEADESGVETLSADFHRGMYRALTWVLGVNHAADLDIEKDSL